MKPVQELFRRPSALLLHAAVLPIFFFTFMLTYRAFDINKLIPYEWFGVHLTIISCIVLLCISLTRVLYYFIPSAGNIALYIFWCLTEIVFASFFVALYLWLVLDNGMQYFEVVAYALKYLFFTLIFPYVILDMSLVIHDYRRKLMNPEVHAPNRMRFYDSQHNLKLVLMPQSVLYIAAEENYVTIYYEEREKVREYLLRSSMKALDELCQENGLVRCHRSYYINPTHVKVLRKDKDGIMYAELNNDELRDIPVSKTYYGKLSEML